jgi:hypothetical protein
MIDDIDRRVRELAGLIASASCCECRDRLLLRARTNLLVFLCEALGRRGSDSPCVDHTKQEAA